MNVDPNAAVRVDGVDAQFNGLIVRESEAAVGDEEAAGIAVFNDGTAVMDNLLVFNNQGRGIYVDSDTQTLAITNSTIRHNQGGGIHVLNDASGTISHNIIDNNNGLSGAGIYLYGVDIMSITDNKITNNDASSRGGGIYVVIVGTEVTIRDNYIAFNDASRGGGIYSASSAVSDISRNFILYNRATYANGRAGGGLYSSPGAAIENNIFAGNMTTDSGQGGGAVFYGLDDNATVRGNTFAYNFSETNGGAAFYIRDGTPTYALEANTIFSNTATSSPLSDYGAVQISNYPATLRYNNFFDNRLYDLMNSAPFAEGPVDAQYNWWATTDPAGIQDQIYDWYDDAAVGMVDYANWLTEPWTAAPVSPPTGMTAVGRSIVDPAGLGGKPGDRYCRLQDLPGYGGVFV